MKLLIVLIIFIIISEITNHNETIRSAETPIINHSKNVEN
jgi:hypothetical protein